MSFVAKSVITIRFLIFLNSTVSLLRIKEKKKWNRKKNVPCARQKSCARGPEPYIFFTSPYVVIFDAGEDLLNAEDIYNRFYYNYGLPRSKVGVIEIDADTSKFKPKISNSSLIVIAFSSSKNQW